MSGHSVRGYIKTWWMPAALALTLLASQFFILNYTTLDQPNEPPATEGASQKHQSCGEGEGLTFAAHTAERIACVFLFKNLRFIDRYHDTLNAISTLAVAIFTATLWATTRQLWEAGKRQISMAKRSADALVIVERAHVYPVIIDAHDVSEYLDKAIVYYLDSNEKIDIEIPDTLSIIFSIKNFGKTPAILKNIYVGFGIYPVSTEFGIGIPESTLGPMERTSVINVSTQNGITRRQVERIGNHMDTLSFTGVIVFDDVWGVQHRTDFIFGWDKDIKRMALQEMKTRTKQPDASNDA